MSAAELPWNSDGSAMQAMGRTVAVRPSAGTELTMSIAGPVAPATTTAPVAGAPAAAPAAAAGTDSVAPLQLDVKRFAGMKLTRSLALKGCVTAIDISDDSTMMVTATAPLSSSDIGRTSATPDPSAASAGAGELSITVWSLVTYRALGALRKINGHNKPIRVARFAPTYAARASAASSSGSTPAATRPPVAEEAAAASALKSRFLFTAGDDGKMIIWETMRRRAVRVLSLASAKAMARRRNAAAAALTARQGTMESSKRSNAAEDTRQRGRSMSAAAATTATGEAADKPVEPRNGEKQSKNKRKPLLPLDYRLRRKANAEARRRQASPAISDAQFLADSSDANRSPHHLLVSHTDGSMALWNWKEGQCLYTLLLREPDAVVSRFSVLDIHGDARLQRLVTACSNGSVGLWDISSAANSKIPGGRTDDGAAVTVRLGCIQPDAEWATSRSQESSKAGWVDPQRFHTGAIRCVAISPNGALLATGSEDCTVKLWSILSLRRDTATLVQIQHREEEDRDRSMGRVGDGGAHGTLLRTLRHHGVVTDLVWTPDSRFLMSCSLDHSIRVWDTAVEQSGDGDYGEPGVAEEKRAQLTPLPSDDISGAAAVESVSPRPRQLAFQFNLPFPVNFALFRSVLTRIDVRNVASPLVEGGSILIGISDRVLVFDLPPPILLNNRVVSGYGAPTMDGADRSDASCPWMWPPQRKVDSRLRSWGCHDEEKVASCRPFIIGGGKFVPTIKPRSGTELSRRHTRSRHRVSRASPAQAFLLSLLTHSVIDREALFKNMELYKVSPTRLLIGVAQQAAFAPENVLAVLSRPTRPNESGEEGLAQEVAALWRTVLAGASERADSILLKFSCIPVISAVDERDNTVKVDSASAPAPFRWVMVDDQEAVFYHRQKSVDRAVCGDNVKWSSSNAIRAVNGHKTECSHHISDALGSTHVVGVTALKESIADVPWQAQDVAATTGDKRPSLRMQMAGGGVMLPVSDTSDRRRHSLEPLVLPPEVEENSGFASVVEGQFVPNGLMREEANLHHVKMERIRPQRVRNGDARDDEALCTSPLTSFVNLGSVRKAMKAEMDAKAELVRESKRLARKLTVAQRHGDSVGKPTPLTEIPKVDPSFFSSSTRGVASAVSCLTPFSPGRGGARRMRPMQQKKTLSGRSNLNYGTSDVYDVLYMDVRARKSDKRALANEAYVLEEKVARVFAAPHAFIDHRNTLERKRAAEALEAKRFDAKAAKKRALAIAAFTEDMINEQMSFASKKKNEDSARRAAAARRYRHHHPPAASSASGRSGIVNGESRAALSSHVFQLRDAGTRDVQLCDAGEHGGGDMERAQAENLEHALRCLYQPVIEARAAQVAVTEGALHHHHVPVKKKRTGRVASVLATAGSRRIAPLDSSPHSISIKDRCSGGTNRQQRYAGKPMSLRTQVHRARNHFRSELEQRQVTELHRSFRPEDRSKMSVTGEKFVG